MTKKLSPEEKLRRAFERRARKAQEPLVIFHESIGKGYSRVWIKSMPNEVVEHNLYNFDELVRLCNMVGIVLHDMTPTRR